MSSESPMSSFTSLSRLQQGVIVSGILAFIASFFPWYGSKGITLPGVGHVGGASISAWHSYSTLAVLLIIASTVIAGVAFFARSSLPDLPVGVAWIVAGLSVLGTFLELLRLLTLHHGDGVAIKWGGYVLAIFMIINAVCAVLLARTSGEPAPWANRGGATPPSPPPA